MRCGPGIPLLPAVDTNGEFMNRALTSEEGSTWLNELLFMIFGVRPSNRVRTHSCKVTTLSWASKFGVQKHLRRTLGYHVAADDVSTFLYSRDAQSEPLRELVRVLRAVELGNFEPDCTRSGRFKVDVVSSETPFNFSRPVAKKLVRDSSETSKGSCPACDNCKNLITLPIVRIECSRCKIVGCSVCLNVSELVETGVCVTVCDTCTDKLSDEGSPKEDSDSDESSESGASSVGIELDEQVARFVLGDKTRRASSFCSDQFVQHKGTGTLHCQHKNFVGRLACGRGLSSAYRMVRHETEFEWTKCSQCFGSSKEDAPV